jgi:hypothetical protein
MSQVPEGRRFLAESVDEFVQTAYHGKCRVEVNEAHRQKAMRLENGPGWYGLPRSAKDYRDIERVIAQGWIDGVAMIYERIDALEVSWVPSVKRRITWTDQGDHLDMSRVYNGQLDIAWQRGMRREANGPRAVRIVVDNCYHAVRNIEEVQWRGIAAIAVAKALEDAGHSVELVTAFRLRNGYGGNNPDYVGQIVTKAMTMPLDIANVSATTAFAGFFRSVSLCFMWQFYAENDRTGGGCGQVEALRMGDVRTLSHTDLYLVTQDIDSQEAAQKWVTKTITTFCEGPNNLP